MNGDSAGNSAFREYERRRANELAAIDVRRSRVKERFGDGRFGSVVAALAVDDSVKASTLVWKQGAIGEQKVARVLDGLAGEDLVVLHDRKLLKSRANFDHLVVTPSRVWVIDAKRYIGKRPERYQEGGFFSSPSVGLKVGGRKRDSLIDGLLGQIVSANQDSLEDPGDAILALAKMCDPLLNGIAGRAEVRDLALRLVNAERIDGKPEALIALGWVGDATDFDLLSDRVRAENSANNSPECRVAAVGALVQLLERHPGEGSRATVEGALRSAIDKDHDPLVREAAAEALQQIDE